MINIDDRAHKHFSPGLRHTDSAVRLTKAILLRLLYGVLSLFFISFVTFLAGANAPGDAAVILAGEKASQESVQNIRHKLGLDRPWYVQYGDYVWKAAHFEFGNSLYGMHQPISKLLAEKAPNTIIVALLAILLASIVGITLGTLGAIFRGRPPDSAILSISTLGVTVPNFVLLPILAYLFANVWHKLPGDWHAAISQYTEWHGRLLPMVVLAARPMAMLTRLTRASMIDTMQQEFIKTATAKGVSPMRLIFKHSLRNAILPVISAIGVNFGFLLTGSFVVETAYSMPGLGSFAIEAISQRNTPAIQATVLVTGAMFIFINLLVDLILPILDPRIREAQV
jgi:peptide/nickel transport system permease protein